MLFPKCIFYFGNLITNLSFGHLVVHLDKRTQVLCEVCICCLCSALPRVSHTPRGISGYGTTCTTQADRQTQAAAALKTFFFFLDAIISCKVHSRGCEEIIPLWSRPLSYLRFGILHVLDRRNNKVTPLSLNPYGTVLIECDAFLSCECFFQQCRPTDDHLSPPSPLFPLISDSLECSPMTLPCQSQHH